MNRNRLMKASAFLLVSTMATSCFVGSTFAKYVSEGKGEDSARVAKWGVEVEVTGDGFKTEYGKDDHESNVEGNTVISSTEEKVVAPGTKGTFGGVTITGTPEVAVKIDTTATVDLSGWNVANDGEFYCPLKFTIGDKTINGLDYSKDVAGGESSFEYAIKDAIQKATTQQLKPNTDLSEVGKGITYSWEWPFEGSTGKVANQDDELDTILGDNAADGDTGNDPKIDITVKTTVTQIN